MTTCEHRFPIYGDHHCRKCGAEPTGLVKAVCEEYDKAPAHCPTCRGPVTFHFDKGTGWGGRYEAYDIQSHASEEGE